jgi:tryptophanyl-tRNA synthetase
MDKKRILTGDRPTGKLHLGHYVGSLKNRVKLQDEYECFFIIADLHTLTTQPEKTDELRDNIGELVLDYLSVGIDPEKSTIFLQSQVPQIPELATIFSMLITVSRLKRVPTLKDVMRDLKIETASFGLLGYPVLQAADILSVRADLVPVGRDQVAHIEVTREIAREFNRLYGNVFPEPQALVGDVPILPGTDGQAKMSKSLGNCIFLSDDKDQVREKVMRMYTDPTRIHGDEPGHVEGNPVFTYLDAFVPEILNPKFEILKEELKARYRKGKVGDVEVKEFLFSVLEEFLTPIRKKRQEFEKKPELIERILKEGTAKARAEAEKTLELVRKSMKLDY